MYSDHTSAMRKIGFGVHETWLGNDKDRKKG